MTKDKTDLKNYSSEKDACESKSKKIAQEGDYLDVEKYNDYMYDLAGTNDFGGSLEIDERSKQDKITDSRSYLTTSILPKFNGVLYNQNFYPQDLMIDEIGFSIKCGNGFSGSVAEKKKIISSLGKFNQKDIETFIKNTKKIKDAKDADKVTQSKIIDEIQKRSGWIFNSSYSPFDEKIGKKVVVRDRELSFKNINGNKNDKNFKLGIPLFSGAYVFQTINNALKLEKHHKVREFIQNEQKSWDKIKKSHHFLHFYIDASPTRFIRHHVSPKQSKFYLREEKNQIGDLKTGRYSKNGWRDYCDILTENSQVEESNQNHIFYTYFKPKVKERILDGLDNYLAYYHRKLELSKDINHTNMLESIYDEFDEADFIHKHFDLIERALDYEFERALSFEKIDFVKVNKKYRVYELRHIGIYEDIFCFFHGGALRAFGEIKDLLKIYSKEKLGDKQIKQNGNFSLSLLIYEQKKDTVELKVSIKSDIRLRVEAFYKFENEKTFENLKKLSSYTNHLKKNAYKKLKDIFTFLREKVRPQIKAFENIKSEEASILQFISKIYSLFKKKSLASDVIENIIFQNFDLENNQEGVNLAFMKMHDRLLLKKNGIIETISDGKKEKRVIYRIAKRYKKAVEKLREGELVKFNK